MRDFKAAAEPPATPEARELDPFEMDWPWPRAVAPADPGAGPHPAHPQDPPPPTV